jgi:hypothetical protein
MMGWNDIPRILKGLFTTENVSDDEIKIGVGFLAIILVLFAILIALI